MLPDFAQNLQNFSLSCQQVGRLPGHRLDQNKPVWIFGAGQFGRDVCSTLQLQGFDVRGFIESKPGTDRAIGLPILRWEQLRSSQFDDQLVVGIFNRAMPLDRLRQIASSAGFSDVSMPWDIYTQFGSQLGWRFWMSPPNVILDNLAAIGRTYHRLADDASRRCLLEICAFRLGQFDAYASFNHDENQYFNDLTLGSLSGRRISYVDGGAYNGDTFLELSKKVVIGEAYLFEPDFDNYQQLTNAVTAAGIPAMCLPLAVSDRYSILSFNAGNGEGGSIADGGSAHIAAVALDQVLAGHRVDFIKLDVEGAEIPALQGAADLIRRCRPTMAISLYHRPEDLWKVPAQLEIICENYNFYIRQHYFNSFDSVLYAIPN